MADEIWVPSSPAGSDSATAPGHPAHLASDGQQPSPATPGSTIAGSPARLGLGDSHLVDFLAGLDTHLRAYGLPDSLFDGTQTQRALGALLDEEGAGYLSVNERSR